MLNIGTWDRARTVAEDLEYLSDVWRPSLNEQQLRRDSPILRRLLVDGQYGDAWRDLGLSGQPFISAPDLDTYLGQTNRNYIQFATTPTSITVASSLLEGAQIKMPVIADMPAGTGSVVSPGYGQQRGLMLAAIPADVMATAAATGQDAIAANVSLGRRHMVGLSIPKFLGSSSAIILGTKITRRDIIKYVANKIGGAHFDLGRNRKGEDRFKLLDVFAKTHIDIAGKPPFSAIYVELLSIAEYLAESSDASRFREIFQKTPKPSK